VSNEINELSGIIKIGNAALEAIRLMTMSPAQYAQVSEQAEYERDVLSLYCLCGPPGMSTARFQEIVGEVAAQSPHENHLVPAHLEYLLKNKWLIDGLPKTLSVRDFFGQVEKYPVECEYRCLERFLALIEAERKR
jgi:hypothetical protein